jgi:hypothetical protein
MTREDLQALVVEALKEQGGSAPLLEVAKYIWRTQEEELRGSGDLFFTWQYDMRWAAQRLRDTGVLRPARSSDDRKWELAKA